MSNKAEFLANEAAIRAIPVKECKSPTMFFANSDK